MKKIPAAELTDEQNAVIIDHLAPEPERFTGPEGGGLVRICECGERFEVLTNDPPEGSEASALLHGSWVRHVWEKVSAA